MGGEGRPWGKIDIITLGDKGAAAINKAIADGD